uniref:7TM_GPCR_Srx domain-containing protein n=1 Tax=Steinernema glaseri TaxID=37863 RepID=A0A1I7YKC6_9BILA
MLRLFLTFGLIMALEAANEVPNSTVEDDNVDYFKKKDYPYAAGVIITTGLFGMMVNGYVFFAVRKATTFGYAFGRIVTSHTVANFGNCFTFGCLIAPLLLINPDIHETYWGTRSGQFLIFVYNASLFSHLLTAINRFCVVYFPIKYHLLFDNRMTMVSIGIVWSIAAIQVLPYFSTNCTLYFDGPNMAMLPKSTFCSGFVITYLCYYLSVAVICVFGVLDFMTFIGIRFHNRNHVATAISTDKMNRKREIRFFFQACLQDCAFLAELILYFSIGPFFVAHKWIHLFMTTFAWIAVHTIDGLIVIMFNKELRTLKKPRGPLLKNSTSNISRNTPGMVMRHVSRN